MKVWRICKARRASTAFTGEGAKGSGGRWNLPGDAVAYTSVFLSTAILEMLVHLDKKLVPPDMIQISAEIPDEFFEPKVEWTNVISEASLPDQWRLHPPPSFLQQTGSDWIRSMASPVLVVPSAVCPSDSNVLINPNHPGFRAVVIGKPEPFSFDGRLL